MWKRYWSVFFRKKIQTKTLHCQLFNNKQKIVFAFSLNWSLQYWWWVKIRMQPSLILTLSFNIAAWLTTEFPKMELYTALYQYTSNSSFILLSRCISVFQITPFVLISSPVYDGLRSPSSGQQQNEVKAQLFSNWMDFPYTIQNECDHVLFVIFRTPTKWSWQKSLMNSLSPRTQPQTTLTLPRQAIAMHPSSFRSWTLQL